MPRRRRLILSGFPHHVTHRGNRRADIFRDDADRRIYLSTLHKYMQRYEVRLYSYCLMSNHVHHIPVPSTADGLSRCLHDVHGFYADYFNRKYGVTGHLWQERFFACVLDSAHLWNAVRYVERNPVEAKMTDRAEDYPWSSAAAHCALRQDPLLDCEFPPSGLIPDWSAWLAHGVESAEIDAIRVATARGIPYASRPFIKELERILGIRLLPRRKRAPKVTTRPDATRRHT